MQCPVCCFYSCFFTYSIWRCLHLKKMACAQSFTFIISKQTRRLFVAATRKAIVKRFFSCYGAFKDIENWFAAWIRPVSFSLNLSIYLPAFFPWTFGAFFLFIQTNFLLSTLDFHVVLSVVHGYTKKNVYFTHQCTTPHR